MSTRQLPEADWKIWRRLSRMILERYCARVLNEVAQYVSNDVVQSSKATESTHQRYLDLYHYLKKCDQRIALVFDGLRRSNAYESIANAVDQGMVAWKELEELSTETQEVVKRFLG